MNNITYNFYRAIQQALVDDAPVDTGEGYFVRFKDFNEWGDESPLQYGVEVLDMFYRPVMDIKYGDFIPIPNYVVGDNTCTKMMAEHIAVELKLVEPKPMPF